MGLAIGLCLGHQKDEKTRLFERYFNRETIPGETMAGFGKEFLFAPKL